MTFFSKENLKALGGVVIAVAIALLPLLSLVPHEVYGASGSADGGGVFGGAVDGGGTGGGPVDGGTSDINTLKNPLQVDSFCALVNLLLKAALVIGIPIAVLFVVYAGFKFIMARGSPAALAEARSNFVATLIGIAIFIGASLIASVILNTLVQLGANNVSAC